MTVSSWVFSDLFSLFVERKSISCLNPTIRSSFSIFFFATVRRHPFLSSSVFEQYEGVVSVLEVQITSLTFTSTFSFLIMTHKNSFTSASVEMFMNPVAIARVALWSSIVYRVVVEVLVLLSKALTRDCIVPIVLRHASVLTRFSRSDFGFQRSSPSS